MTRLLVVVLAAAECIDDTPVQTDTVL